MDLHTRQLHPRLLWPVALATCMLLAACGPDAAGMAGPDANAPENVVWSDAAAGGSVGDVAPNAVVTLRDGTTATLEEVAGGGPMLLYYFATW